MRSYATINPLMWTRGSGKKLRGNANAFTVFFHLLSSPHSSMTGIYHLNLSTLEAETGLSAADVQRGLSKCIQEGLAFYDEDEEIMFVPALSHHQVGRELMIGKNGKPDHKITGLLKALQPFANHRFVGEWIRRYERCYSLRHPALREKLEPLLRGFEGASRFESSVEIHSLSPSPLPSPFEGAYDPDPVSDPDLSDPDLPDRLEQAQPAGLQERAAHLVRDPMAHTFDDPAKWPEVREVFVCFAQTWNKRPIVVHAGLSDPRLRVVVERFAQHETVDSLRRALRGSKEAKIFHERPELQTLETILRDAGTVAKYSAMVDEPRVVGSVDVNHQRLLDRSARAAAAKTLGRQPIFAKPPELPPAPSEGPPPAPSEGPPVPKDERETKVALQLLVGGIG